MIAGFLITPNAQSAERTRFRRFYASVLFYLDPESIAGTAECLTEDCFNTGLWEIHFFDD